MDNARFVDGDGWISDESDFYGDETTKISLEKSANRVLEPPQIYFPTRTNSLKQSSSSKTAATETLRLPTKSTTQHQPPVTGSVRPIKARNEIEAADLLEDDRYDRSPSVKQENETIEEFLKRAPIDKPSIAGLGPWLWVRNPKAKSDTRQREAIADVEAFVEGGNLLLTAYQAQKDEIAKANSGAAEATITRKLGPHRDQLEEDILALAVNTGTTCGKWMLFPSGEDYPRHWRLVAEAADDGRLGPVCKAATYTDVNPINLICVYTSDFTERDDVHRVLEELIKLGLCTRAGRPIYYKCDAYTYLGITSSNDYKLRASLYSSREILGLETKAKKDGPVDRLNKRSLRS